MKNFITRLVTAKVLAGLLSVAWALPSSGQSIAALPYDPGTINFNSYNSGTLPTGWTSQGTFRGAGTGSSNQGGLYAYGSGSDFSLGALNSGSAGTQFYTVSFTNNSGSAITSLTLSWDYRQYRFANTSGWNCTGTGALASNATLNGKDFTGVASGTTGSGVTTPVASFTLSGLSIANGAAFGITWLVTDASSSDNGVAIDNFRIQAAGGPPPPAPAATFTELTAGMAASPLMAGSTDKVLFGFAATSTASGSTSPTTQSFTALTIPTTSNSNGSLTNVRLVRSTDNDPTTTGDNTTVGTFTQNAANLQITVAAQALNSTAKNYFVVADVQGTVNASTPTLGHSLANTGVTVSGGTVNAFSFAGEVYSFISTGTPALMKLYTSPAKEKAFTVPPLTVRCTASSVPAYRCWTPPP